MKDRLPFDDFLRTLSPTNRTLDFFVDWQKCIANTDKISICLNHLNLLLGKPKSEMKAAVELLFAEYPKAFSVLNLLIAVRKKNELVITQNGELVGLDSYFESGEKAFEFIEKTGLIDIFSDKKIINLNDFVFGVEVGLDTNARKNRSGTAMERCVADIFKAANLEFSGQAEIKDFTEIDGLFGDDIKRFDFVVFSGVKKYFIECNFYTIGGSKLNETARGYQELAAKFKNVKNCDFVWITDGQGWLEAKNKLGEAYKSVEIYNLSNIADFIKKVKNAQI